MCWAKEPNRSISLPLRDRSQARSRSTYRTPRNPSCFNSNNQFGWSMGCLTAVNGAGSITGNTLPIVRTYTGALVLSTVGGDCLSATSYERGGDPLDFCVITHKWLCTSRRTFERIQSHNRNPKLSPPSLKELLCPH